MSGTTACGTAKPAIQVLCNNAESTSLHILNAVDKVVDKTLADQRTLSGLVGIAQSLTESIENCDREAMIDPDGEGAAACEKTERGMRTVVASLENRIASAVADPKLISDNQTAVVTEFENLMAVAKALHDAMVGLRWAVMEHDADLDSDDGKVFNTAEELIADLRG